MQTARWTALIVALALFLWLASYLSCGHVVPGEYAPNLGGEFDLRQLDELCPRGLAPRPKGGRDFVLVRYLGAGGLYLEWRGQAVMTGPFFTDYSAMQVEFGRLRPDPVRIARGLAGLDLDKVHAILLGHSHYDHLGDVPWIVEHAFRDKGRAPPAVFVNDSGAKALAAYSDIPVRTYARAAGPWLILAEDAGRPRIRAWPVPSFHAPHFYRLLLFQGSLAAPWDDAFEAHRPAELLEGGTCDFVLDFLEDDGSLAFRMFYQDSASGAGQAWPLGLAPGDEHPIDVAVLCMASYAFVRDAPGWLVRRLRPRHVLVTHWEDFFQGQEQPPRFVVFLNDRAVETYFRRLGAALAGIPVRPTAHASRQCGPSAPGWTLPLPGEWIDFATMRP